MMASFFVDFTLSDNDKKLLIVLLFVLILLFIIVGLIGWLIRFVTVRFEGRMDYEITMPSSIASFKRRNNSGNMVERKTTVSS